MSEKELPYGYKPLPEYYCEKLKKFMTCNGTCLNCTLPETIETLRKDFTALSQIDCVEKSEDQI